MPHKRCQSECLEVVNRDCAGIDIGKYVHNVAVDLHGATCPPLSPYHPKMKMIPYSFSDRALPTHHGIIT